MGMGSKPIRKRRASCPILSEVTAKTPETGLAHATASIHSKCVYMGLLADIVAERLLTPNSL